MPDRVYLDWNATTPLRDRSAASDGDAAGIFRVMHPRSMRRAGKPAEMDRGRAGCGCEGRRGACRETSSFTSGGTEANALGADAGHRRGTSPAVTRLVVSAIEHASVLAGGRFPPNQSKRSASRRAGVVDLDHLRATASRCVRLRWCRSCWPTMKPALFSRSSRRPRSCMPQTACCMWMQSRRSGKFRWISVELNADLLTLSAHKIGGPKGVGALVLAEGMQRAGAAAAWRRPGTGPSGRNRECGGHCRLRRRGEGRHGAACRQRGLVWRLCGNRLENGLRQTPGVIVFSDAVQRLPNTTLFTVPGLKAETAVIGFDLAGIAVSSGFGLLFGQGATVPCAGSDGIRARDRPRRGAAQYGLVYAGCGRRSLPGGLAKARGYPT